MKRMVLIVVLVFLFSCSQRVVFNVNNNSNKLILVNVTYYDKDKNLIDTPHNSNFFSLSETGAIYSKKQVENLKCKYMKFSAYEYALFDSIIKSNNYKFTETDYRNSGYYFSAIKELKNSETQFWDTTVVSRNRKMISVL